MYAMLIHISLQKDPHSTCSYDFQENSLPNLIKFIPLFYTKKQTELLHYMQNNSDMKS